MFRLVDSQISDWSRFKHLTSDLKRVCVKTWYPEIGLLIIIFSLKTDTSDQEYWGHPPFLDKPKYRIRGHKSNYGSMFLGLSRWQIPGPKITRKPAKRPPATMASLHSPILLIKMVTLRRHETWHLPSTSIYHLVRSVSQRSFTSPMYSPACHLPWLISCG